MKKAIAKRCIRVDPKRLPHVEVSNHDSCYKIPNEDEEKKMKESRNRRGFDSLSHSSQGHHQEQSATGAPGLMEVDTRSSLNCGMVFGGANYSSGVGIATFPTYADCEQDSGMSMTALTAESLPELVISDSSSAQLRGGVCYQHGINEYIDLGTYIESAAINAYGIAEDQANLSTAISYADTSADSFTSPFDFLMQEPSENGEQSQETVNNDSQLSYPTDSVPNGFQQAPSGDSQSPLSELSSDSTSAPADSPGQNLSGKDENISSFF